MRFTPGKKAELFTLIIKGTVEDNWFKKSTSKLDFTPITEAQLYEILKLKEDTNTIFEI